MKDYQKPEIEIISLIAEESITADGLTLEGEAGAEGEMGAISNPF